jgi:hypothetical protein
MLLMRERSLLGGEPIAGMNRQQRRAFARKSAVKYVPNKKPQT